MPNFCSQCGSPVAGPFCGKCGAKVEGPKAQAAPVPAPAAPPASPPVVSAAPAEPKSSSASKILLLVAVVVLVIGAAAVGGMYYVYHRVKQRVQAAVADAGLGSMSQSTESKSTGAGNNAACRYLSKEEVSQALGVQIVGMQSESDSDCSYLAHGTGADMTARHLSAMTGAKGADAKTQQMAEQFASTILKSMPQQQSDESQDRSGNVPVLAFSIDTNAAETQMRLNGGIFGSVGPVRQNLPGIGDEAYDIAGAMVFVRKGDKLVRIMYTTCPCTLDAIKPLAKELADSI